MQKRLGACCVLGACIAACMLLLVPDAQAAAAQDDLDMELEVSGEQRILLFGGFAIAVAAIFVFLARDTILRRKTTYDSENLESKKDKTYEKYHSDWSDEYEEVGTRESKISKEMRQAAKNGSLPDYYGVLGLSHDATHDEIKARFRELAKKTHPDKAGQDYKEQMAQLNEAYSVLSDEEDRKRYDSYRRQG